MIKMPKDLGEVGSVIGALTSSSFENNPCFEFFKTSKLALSPPAAMSWSLDGERCEPVKIIDIDNFQKAIEFIVPKQIITA